MYESIIVITVLTIVFLTSVEWKDVLIFSFFSVNLCRITTLRSAFYAREGIHFAAPHFMYKVDIFVQLS